jgi:hypothetical protein
MRIVFASGNNAIVYTLETITSFCRNIHHPFATQCVSWLSYLIGLQQGFVIYINNLHSQEISNKREFRGVSSTSSDIARTSASSDNQEEDLSLESTETFLQKSESARKENVSHPFFVLFFCFNHTVFTLLRV